MFNNCMEALGPRITSSGAAAEAVSSYPSCEESCEYKRRYLQEPVFDERGFGIYDTYKSQVEEPDSTCQVMCWNTEAQTGAVGSNNVMVGDNFFNYSMPVPPINRMGTDMMVAGGLLCITFVSCFTTCFKGRTKAKVMSAAEQKAKWEAEAAGDAAAGNGVNKIKQAIADATAVDLVHTKVKKSAVRVVPTVGDPAVDHLPLTMKSKRTLAGLHRKRGIATLPPIEGAKHNRDGTLAGMNEEEDDDRVVPEEEEPETAAEVAALALAERKRVSVVECL